MEDTVWRRITVGPVALLCTVFFAAGKPLTHAQETGTVHVPLTVEKVVKNLEQATRERADAPHAIKGKRVYRLQYNGVLGDRGAEVAVKVVYQSPATMEFAVISQSGSTFVIDRVFKKLLEAEQEALRPENQKSTTLSTENYVFGLAGYEDTSEGARYVLSVSPKHKNKFLYRGKVWVDAVDFAVVRIQAEPAKNPSFWIKKSLIDYTYAKVNNFWLPAYSQTHSLLRLGGRAVLTIEYKDYKVTHADPPT